jgi:hypothetical protein
MKDLLISAEVPTSLRNRGETLAVDGQPFCIPYLRSWFSSTTDLKAKSATAAALVGGLTDPKVAAHVSN